MKQLSTKEFAELIGKSTRNTCHSLSMLTLLQHAIKKAATQSGLDATQRRINRKLRWLGPDYVSHKKIGNQWVVTVKSEQ